MLSREFFYRLRGIAQMNIVLSLVAEFYYGRGGGLPNACLALGLAVYGLYMAERFGAEDK